MNSAEFKSAAQGMNKSDSSTIWLLEPRNNYNFIHARHHVPEVRNLAR